MATLDRTYGVLTPANDNLSLDLPFLDEEFDEDFSPLEAFVSGLMSVESDDLFAGATYE